MEFLGAAARACPHGLMVEQEGCIVYANPAYARLLGFRTPAAVLGKRLQDMPPPVAADHKPHNGNNGMPNNGMPEIDSTRLQFRSARRSLALHVVRDVSERKRLEQRLRDSEKMEALGRLVGGVAHDFNNLLTAITLYSDLLLEQAPHPPRREAEEIHLAAERGAAMVRQLLAFARQQPMRARVVSLKEVVTSMRGMVETLLGADIELITNFSGEQDAVRMDPAQLQEVILNLVLNARDAMPNGGRLRIETGNCSMSVRSARRYPGLRAGRYLTLAVVDTGHGMDEQVRSRLFEPFFTTKKVGEGTGLGMAMVYGIVTQSSGSLTVSSKPGKGTRVTILLPRAPAQPQRDDGSEVAASASGSETVLLLEDDAAVRTSIAHLLSQSGYRVLQARDGAHGIKLARAHEDPIHLLLSDVVMPGVGGCDAARAIRELHPETKVLFISGYPAKARMAAADALLLYKPFSRAVLTQKVREVLDHRSPAIAGGASFVARREKESL
jgi:two-component system, cell cycle sensor histidine kinase and response regulator CckA